MSEKKDDDRFLYKTGDLELTNPGSGPLLFSEDDDDEPEPPAAKPEDRTHRGLISRLVRKASK